LRGLTTLPLRMRQHCENAIKVAEFLESHPKVERVIYPGLGSHPHHELAKSQMTAAGGMLSFRLKGGMGASISLLEKVKVFTYATSLGHAHSLLFYYPTEMYFDSGVYLSKEQKKSIREWTGDGIIRASIGLESGDDLLKDLDQALRGKTVRGVAVPLAYKLVEGKK